MDGRDTPERQLNELYKEIGRLKMRLVSADSNSRPLLEDQLNTCLSEHERLVSGQQSLVENSARQKADPLPEQEQLNEQDQFQQQNHEQELQQRQHHQQQQEHISRHRQDQQQQQERLQELEQVQKQVQKMQQQMQQQEVFQRRQQQQEQQQQQEPQQQDQLANKQQPPQQQQVQVQHQQPVHHQPAHMQQGQGMPDNAAGKSANVEMSPRKSPMHVVKDAPEVGGGPTTRSASCERSAGEEAPRAPVRPVSPPSNSPSKRSFGPGFGAGAATSPDQTEQLAQAMNLVATLRKEIDALRGNFQSAETKCKRFQDRAKAAETRCDRLAQELRDAQRAKQKLELTVTSLRQKLSARQRDESQTRWQLQDLQAGAEAMAQEHARQSHENMQKLRVAQEQLLTLRQREVMAVCQNTMLDVQTSMASTGSMNKSRESLHSRSSRPDKPRTSSTPPGMTQSRTHSSPPGMNRSVDRKAAMKAAAMERLDKVISATQAAMEQKAQERASPRTSPEKAANVIPQKLELEQFSSEPEMLEKVQILTKESMPSVVSTMEADEIATRENRTPSFERLEEEIALAEASSGPSSSHMSNSFSWGMLASAQSAVKTATDNIADTLNNSYSSLPERSPRRFLDQTMDSQFCPPPMHAPPDVLQQARFSNTPRGGASPRNPGSRGTTPPRMDQNGSVTPPRGASPPGRGNGVVTPRAGSPRGASRLDPQPRESLSRSGSRGVFSRLANTFTASTAHLRDQAQQPRSTTPKGIGFRRQGQAQPAQPSRKSLGRDTVTSMHQLPTDGNCAMRTG
eukprot:gnl/MRDRNA2_/MRDRNA2_71850_c1_seq1.p1 gnl/MRDRNA2_/MRDRNA2_71850_c1~~gnl/MRDRNA2_/MRDRNA2_71850_c1_seq1.p1  ORF type:complete len:796 (+),score=193.03 gnl/MRDRNA2_/MRDRNA2_71850_c1_seq1:106-2493(+)